MLLPTSRLAAAAGAVALVSAAAVAIGPLRPIVYVLDILLILACAFDAWSCPRRGGVEAIRRFPRRVPRGAPVHLQYEIRGIDNRTFDGRADSMEIRDETPESVLVLREPAPRPGENGAGYLYESEVVPRQRGKFIFPALHIRCRSPLRLFMNQFRKPLETALEVDPPVAGLAEGLRRVREMRREAGRASVRVRGRASAFEQLRDHVDGDEFRTIDWKATARRGHLTVREYRTERNRDVTICIDFGRRMAGRFRGESKCDAALDAGLSLARAALAAGDRVGMIAFAHEPILEIASRRGDAHFQQIFEQSRHLSEIARESNLLALMRYLRARRRKRGFLLIISDLPDPISARRILPALAGAARTHSMLFVAVDDAERRAMEEADVRSTEDVYPLAGARALRAERLQSIAEFRRHGIRAADLTPSEITGPVLDAYFSAARGEEF
ncbi:MAG: DUF58 domain-containing protein [Planctomycetes bacterium]|nr:DUF58 domain-containing protein [Planctomycetota bacterium]